MPDAPDLDRLAEQIGASLAAQVGPVVARLEAKLARVEAEFATRIEAATVRSALIDRDGGLVLMFGDGSTRSLGIVVGKDGRDGVDGRDGLDARNGVDGKDGADGPSGRDGVDGSPGPAGAPGLGFHDMSADLAEDGRTVVISFRRDDLAQTFELPFPTMLYRGVYAANAIYQPGDCVTFGGSVWVCGAPTSAKPGEAESAWTLAVKRGRDGKDFAGPPRLAGPQLKVG